MDHNRGPPFDGADDAEYMANFQSLPRATAATPNTLFANPVWGTETELSTTTFTPGVYLHNKDAAYGYLDPHDSTGLTDWAKSISGGPDPSSTSTMSMTPVHGHYLPTASPTKQPQQPAWSMDATGQPGASSSSSSSSSYTMVNDATAIPPPILSGRVRLSAASHSTSTAARAVRSSRIAKPKAKPVGGSTRLPLNNSSNSASSSSNSQYPKPPGDRHQSISSASSSASPPLDEVSPHRNRSASLFAGGGGGGGGVSGLLTTGHGGNHNVTLRTASRKPKPQLAAPTGASSSYATGTGGGEPKAESSHSDASGAVSSPSSPDDGSGNTESLTSEERRARQNHNIVEKQYRNRLNSQFERLLSILPANQMEGVEMGRTVEFDERRMSKAEVLDLARRRIHALENEIQQLYTDRDNLRSNVASLNLAIQSGQQQQQQPQQQQPKMGITI